MTLSQRYQGIAETVAQAAEKAGRAPEDVLIIGVSKTVGLDKVAEAIAAGIHDFGENRPEQLMLKHDAYPDQNWHFIGNIQSRQLKNVVGRACLIHSLFKAEHADKISQLATQAGIVQHVLLEVNDGEDQKQGVAPDQLYGLLKHCLSLPGISVDGLMIMAPRSDAESASATFAMLQQLRDQMVERLAQEGIDAPLTQLSAGMSNDFPYAIPYGSTMVRVGRAIFSDDYQNDLH